MFLDTGTGAGLWGGCATTRANVVFGVWGTIQYFSLIDVAARRARAWGTWGGMTTKGRLWMAASPAKKKRAADARAPSSRRRTWLLSTVGVAGCCRLS